MPIKGQITERDLQALRWTAEQGVMTIPQFWRAVWWNKESKSPSFTYDRILFLSSNKYLEKVKIDGTKKICFRLSLKGYRQLSESGIYSGQIPKARVPIREIPHALALTDLRIEVEKSGKITSWTTDRVLSLDPDFPRNRFRQTLPDAIYVSKKSGKRVAVEYERTRKQRSRVLSKIHAYTEEMMRRDRFADLVVWIVTEAANQDAYRLARTCAFQAVDTLDGFLEALIST